MFAVELRNSVPASAAPTDADSPRLRTRLQFTTLKLLAIPIVFAVVLGLLRSFDVPEWAAVICGSISATAICAIILLSRSSFVSVTALAAIAIGSLIGGGVVFLRFVRGPAGIQIGAVIGFVVYLIVQKAAQLVRSHFRG